MGMLLDLDLDPWISTWWLRLRLQVWTLRLSLHPGSVYLNLSAVKLPAGGRPTSPTLRGEAAIRAVWGGGAPQRIQGRCGGGEAPHHAMGASGVLVGEAGVYICPYYPISLRLAYIILYIFS